jgi:ribosomal protein S18 acetylase RimI-like enzyme
MAARLAIETADAASVATIVDWAADEGWNPGLHDAAAFHSTDPGLHDAAAFHSTDPGGFLIGSIAGERVGAISVVRHGPSFAFLGLYLVRPKWRGQGHGLALWRAGLELAGDRVIGLDGVVARQDDYRRSGFTLVRRNVRYAGRGGGRSASATSLRALTDIPSDALLDYDAGVFPVGRELYLRAWLAMPGSHGLAAVHDGRVAGYGVARRCRTGVKVGPLFADDAPIADAIFDGLAAWAGEGSLFLDVPEPNGAAVALAERRGMTPVFETARMYRGGPPDEPIDRIFGVTSFELG